MSHQCFDIFVTVTANTNLLSQISFVNFVDNTGEGLVMLHSKSLASKEMLDPLFLLTLVIYTLTLTPSFGGHYILREKKN